MLFGRKEGKHQCQGPQGVSPRSRDSTISILSPVLLVHFSSLPSYGPRNLGEPSGLGIQAYFHIATDCTGLSPARSSLSVLCALSSLPGPYSSVAWSWYLETALVSWTPLLYSLFTDEPCWFSLCRLYTNPSSQPPLLLPPWAWSFVTWTVAATSSWCPCL